MKGANRSTIGNMTKGANGDVWTRLDNALATQTDNFGATKVKAHLTLGDVVAGTISFGQYVGNGLADIAAEAAALKHQPDIPLVNFAQKSFATCVLLNFRLAAIEAHVWHVAALSQVPEPLLPPLPILSDLQAARDDALTRLKASRHKLYRRDGRLYCARCQKRKILAKSHLWASTPCLPPTSTDDTDTPQTPPHDDATDEVQRVQRRDDDIASQQHCAPSRLDIDDYDCHDIDRAIADEASFHADADTSAAAEQAAFDEPPEDPHPTCTVSAAKRIRKQHN